jgi:hypothetical protein
MRRRCYVGKTQGNGAIGSCGAMWEQSVKMDLEVIAL